MYDVITIGSAVRDIFIRSKDIEIKQDSAIILKYGSKIDIAKMSISYGGGGLNNAIAFSRLGFKTAFLGEVGLDADGDAIANELKKENVSTELLIRSKDETGSSVIIVGSSNERTILAYRGANMTMSYSEVKWNKLRAKLFLITHLYGDSAKLLPHIVKHAKKTGAIVAINPGSMQLKNGMNYLKKILDRVDIFIVNEEEAETLTGVKEHKALKKMREIADIIVITKGNKGSITFDGRKFYTAGVHRAKIINRVGLGDAFSSGFSAGMLLKNDVEYAIKLGSTNATAVGTHKDAHEGLLKSPKTKELKVTVEGL